jgi:hypothetical protein
MMGGPSRELTLAEIVNKLPMRHRARAEHAQLAIALGNAQTALWSALPVVLSDCTGVAEFEKEYPELYELIMADDNGVDGPWGKHCAQIAAQIRSELAK